MLKTEEEKIIEIKLGNISGEFDPYILKYYVGCWGDNRKCLKINYLKYLILEILFLLLFFISGIILTLLFHKKCYSFFYKRTQIDLLDPHSYKFLKSTHLLGRVILLIISFLITINIFLFILYKIKEYVSGRAPQDYNWNGLYTALKQEGYNPLKYNYITVSSTSKGYKCMDGNHRLKILTYLYGPHKKIKVKDIGNIFYL